jgi:hypothetical protein
VVRDRSAGEVGGAAVRVRVLFGFCAKILPFRNEGVSGRV